MVYFSYFSNPRIRGLPANKLIAISRKVPADFRGAEIDKDLAPNWSTLERYRKDNDYRAYIKTYCRTRLKRLDAAEVARKYENKILLCYEKPGENVFCHRLIIMAWLRKHGIECRELPYSL